jgi:hypothetical protein
MNRRALVIVPAAAIITVIITAVATGSSSVSLPVPQAVVVHQLPFSGHNPGSTSKGTTTTTKPTSTLEPGVTVPKITPLTGCVASVSDPHPVQSHTAESVTVVAVAGAEVKIVAGYSRAVKHNGLVGSSGSIAFSLPISSAPVGVTVPVTVTASLGSVHKTCQTSFTPVP